MSTLEKFLKTYVTPCVTWMKTVVTGKGGPRDTRLWGNPLKGCLVGTTRVILTDTLTYQYPWCESVRFVIFTRSFYRLTSPFLSEQSLCRPLGSTVDPGETSPDLCRSWSLWIHQTPFTGTGGCRSQSTPKFPYGTWGSTRSDRVPPWVLKDLKPDTKTVT